MSPKSDLAASPRVDERSATTPRSMPHSLLDRGGTAVLLMVVGLFIVPERVWIALGPALGAPRAPSFELHILVGSALLALVLPVMQIVMHIRRVGGDVIRGNREGFPVLSGMAGRVARAHANLVESLGPFAVAVLVAHAEGVTNRETVAAAGVYFAARVVHAATYTMGITVIRSAAFYAGLIATVQIAVAALRLG